jgi:hypothetical protein
LDHARLTPRRSAPKTAAAAAAPRAG